MINKEDRLQKLANKLAQEKYQKYDSRFISIVNVLKSNLKVSEARRGGSFGKQTKTLGFGDLDILFTYQKPLYKPDIIREKTRKRLYDNFNEIAEVTKKTNSVELDFKSEEMKIDVVYLPLEEYQKQVSEVEEVKEANKLEHDAIRLLKFYKYKKLPEYLKSMKIENKILSFNGKSLCHYVEEVSIRLGINQFDVIRYLMSDEAFNEVDNLNDQQ